MTSFMGHVWMYMDPAGLQRALAGSGFGGHNC
jgi:hypothetical protein